MIKFLLALDQTSLKMYVYSTVHGYTHIKHCEKLTIAVISSATAVQANVSASKNHYKLDFLPIQLFMIVFYLRIADRKSESLLI